jgi:hypothetical protein
MPFALLLLAGALAGCSKSTNPAAGSSSDDESQAMVAMTQDPAVVEDGVSDSEDATAMDGGDLERSGSPRSSRAISGGGSACATGGSSSPSPTPIRPAIRRAPS